MFPQRFVFRNFIVLIFLILISCLYSPLVHSAEVTLAWDPNTDPDLGGYKIHYGLSSGNYSKLVDVGDPNPTAAVITGLVEGQTYYFAATAYDTSNNESNFSNEITYTVPVAQNNAPTIKGSIPDQTKDENAEAWSLDLTGFESDKEDSGKALDWSVKGANKALISIAIVDSDNDTLTITPVANAHGSDIITLTLTDSGGLSASQDITITLTQENIGASIFGSNNSNSNNSKSSSSGSNNSNSNSSKSSSSGSNNSNSNSSKSSSSGSNNSNSNSSSSSSSSSNSSEFKQSTPKNLNSVKTTEAFVKQYYKQGLNRNPDQPGLNGWTNALIEGSATGEDFAYSLIFSQEFIERNTTNEEFITTLYRTLLGREPEADGYNSHVNALNKGLSREEILDGFIYSQEFQSLLEKNGINPYAAEASIANGSKIALKASNGQYVGTESGGGGLVYADRELKGPQETFELIDLGNNIVALINGNGHSLRADSGGSGLVYADRFEIGDWEKFELIDLGNNRVALQAHNGPYLCAEGGGGGLVYANCNEISELETFTLEFVE